MPYLNALPTSRPEIQGVAPENLIAFLNAIAEKEIALHAMTLVRHGHVVTEAFWRPYRKELPRMLFSLSKSFTATAIGIASDEGLLSSEDLVISFFPDDLPDHLDEHYKRLKIKHLLCMGTGHKNDFIDKIGNQADGIWPRVFFQEPIAFEPGTHFVYNNLATYMLSAIITKVTGKSLLDYLKPRLFDPLGIKNPTWETDPKGINCGAWGLSLTCGEIARFGQMLLQKGVYNGQRIVSEQWIDAAASKQLHNGDNSMSDWNQGYGYQFWMCRHNAYRGDGMFGQFCIIFPDKDAVLVLCCAMAETQIVLDLVYEHVLSGLRSTALPLSNSYNELIKRTEELHYAPITGKPVSPVEKAMDRKVFRLAENPMNFETFTLSFGEDDLKLVFTSPRGDDVVMLGRERWLDGHTTLNDYPNEERMPYRCAASFTWQTNETLLMDIRLIETPFQLIIGCALTGSEIQISAKVNLPLEAPEMRMQGLVSE